MLRAFILVWVILFVVTKVNAQDEYQILDDLSLDWKVFSEEKGDFEPYIDQVSPTTVYFDLDVLKYREFSLRIKAPKGYYFFVNGQLAQKFDDSKVLLFDIDSLIGTTDENYLTLSIFSKDFNRQRVQTQIISKSLVGGSFGIADSWNDQRERIQVSDQFIVISILILGLVVVLKTTNNRLFQEYFDFYHLLSVRQRFELIPSYSLFSIENLSFLILYSVLTGASCINFLFNAGANQEPHWSAGISELAWGFIFSIASGLLMILKLPLIASIASLFRVSRIRQLHFFTYFRLSMVFALVVFVLSALNTISHGYWVTSFKSVLLVALTILLIIRLSIVSIVLNSELNFQKLHIFSYLCSTEIIPLVFFLKILIK